MAATAAPLQPLAPQALTLRRIRLLGSLAPPVVAAPVVVALLGAPAVAAALGTVGLGILLTVLAAQSWWVRAWGWQLQPDRLVVRRGVVVRQVTTLPRSRIQNVTTSAGPLQRSRRVTDVTVHTAGSKTPNVTIPDLALTDAETIRTRLIAAAGAERAPAAPAGPTGWIP